MSSLVRIAVTAGYRGHPAALDGLRLEIEAGEILALIGQSGSGKSTLALAILGLLGMRGGSVSGSIEFEGRNLLTLNGKQWRTVRGRRIGLVFQSAATALNPYLSVEDHVREAWRAHETGILDLAALLQEVSLPADRGFLRRRPGQLSIGQAQRVLIALGIVHRPALLIADEPTSALDAVTQAEILDLFAGLNRKRRMSILLITHDLLSAAKLAHRVAILRQGKLVECGTTQQIFENPGEEYTRRLCGQISRLSSHLLQVFPLSADQGPGDHLPVTTDESK